MNKKGFIQTVGPVITGGVKEGYKQAKATHKAGGSKKDVAKSFGKGVIKGAKDAIKSKIKKAGLEERDLPEYEATFARELDQVGITCICLQLRINYNLAPSED